jgi:exonuclease III
MVIKTRSREKKRREENEQLRIHISTYNIRNGRQGNLKSALRALQFMNVDLDILQETKISDEKYTRASFGYEVLASKADTVFQGGISLAYRASCFCTVKSIRIEGANVISFLLITGKRQYTCLGAYTPQVILK